EAAEAKLEEVAEAAAEVHRAAQLPEHELGALVEATEVHAPQGASNLVVVTTEDVVYLRGGARATDVLEEQGVEQVGQCRGVERQAYADAHADHAAAQGVVLVLALGDVERMAERSDQVAEQERLRRPAAYLGKGRDATRPLLLQPP